MNRPMHRFGVTVLFATAMVFLCPGGASGGDVTDLGVPTDVITVVGALPSYHDAVNGTDLLDVTFTAVIDFDDKLPGEREVIFETGGGTNGLSLVYEEVNMLVLRASGDGGFALATVPWMLPANLIAGGDVDLAWTYDVDDGQGLQTVSLLVNGVRVNSVTMELDPLGDWSGTNAGAFGVASTQLAGTGNNTTLAGGDFLSGLINTVEGLSFYVDTHWVPTTTDADGDGLPDEWEALFAVNLGAGDTDGDGLSDVEELQLGTNPVESDSDSDGIGDGAEEVGGTDPLNPDTDGDGLGDNDELTANPPTDPTNPDTDGDNFLDGAELTFGSDATDPDSVPAQDCVAALPDPPTEVVDLLGTLSNYERGDPRLDQQDASFTALVDFDPKTDGFREIIFEAGGGTTGISLVYEAPSALVLRASGNGGFTVTTIRYPLSDFLVDGGEVDLAWSFDVDHAGIQTVSLIVNDFTVRSVSLELDPDWCGGNDSAFGVASTNITAAGNNSPLQGGDFVSGLIITDIGFGLQFYSGAVYCPVTSDADGDGLPDEWERLYSANLATLGAGDADGDGLSNEDELELGGDPTASDSDLDGLDDGDEVARGTDLADPDSDDDGLSDGDEVNGDPATDPKNPDTDGDGFSDGREVRRGSDPTDENSIPPPCTPDLGDPTETINTASPNENGLVIGPMEDYRTRNGGGWNVLDTTFTAVVDFLPKTEGEREVIFETGGGTRGLSLVYEVPSALVLRASGDGGFALATIRYVLPDSLIDGGDILVAWAYDVDDGQGLQAISLIINDVEVGSLTMAIDPNGDWSGTNNAAFGVETTGFAGTGGNTDLRGVDFISGFINEEEGLKFYSDRFYCPETTDADGDGLPDEWEDLYSPGNLNRLGAGDADGDGLTDLEELEGRTHPTNADTDGDGLEDGDEDANNTDPHIADTDGDGRSDGDEVNGDPTSDPTNPDTDGDGFPDGFEVDNDADPNDAGSVPEQDCVTELDDPAEIITVLGALPTYHNRPPIDPLDPDPTNLDQRDATFLVVIDFFEKTAGEREVIWESGGGTTGFSVVYEATNTLVLRAAGSGGFVVATASYELPQAVIDGGEVEVAWTYDVDHSGLSTISLIVDRVTVARATAALGGDWTGNNAAAFGVASGNMAAAGNNNPLTGVDFISGTINLVVGLEFHAGTLWCPDGTPPVACDTVNVVCTVIGGAPLVVEATVTALPGGCDCSSVELFIDDVPAGTTALPGDGVIQTEVPGCTPGTHRLEVVCNTRTGRAGGSGTCDFDCPGGDGGFIRGDSNADGGRNITDGVFIFSHLFTGGPPPPCRDAADTSDQGSINITSGIYILNHLFLGGPAPPAPFPQCGADQTADALDCLSFPPCP